MTLLVALVDSLFKLLLNLKNYIQIKKEKSLVGLNFISMVLTRTLLALN